MDAPNVCLYRWYITNRNYVRTTLPGGAKIELQRFLMNPPEGKVVDHKDRNTLNNVRANLRNVTPLQNAQNQPLKEDRTTKYRGVHLKEGKYIVRVNDAYIGSFDSPMIAAMQHDRYIINKGLDMIELNFKDLRDDYLAEDTYEVPKYKKETKYDGVVCRNDHAHKDKPYKAEHKKKKGRILIWESANEEECARKWDEYVVKNGLSKRRLNFPESYPDYGKPMRTKTNCVFHSPGVLRLIIDTNPDAEVLIDEDQYDKVKVYKWSFSNGGGRITAKSERNTYKLKRVIMDETDPKVDIVYKSSNKLDNRKSNLMRVG